MPSSRHGVGSSGGAQQSGTNFLPSSIYLDHHLRAVDHSHFTPFLIGKQSACRIIENGAKHWLQY
eukprot:575466-Amorphochlora_amoeboformis.AAC.1